MRNNEMIPFNFTFLHETDKAILILQDGEIDDGKNGIWLPKSKIIYDDNEYARGDEIEVEVPRWLVESKDLE